MARSSSAGVQTPHPQPDELLLRVLACGVCRTDLHVIDGELPVHHSRVIPGYQVVCEVMSIGSAVRTLAPGGLVGVAWLRSSRGATGTGLGNPGRTQSHNMLSGFTAQCDGNPPRSDRLRATWLVTHLAGDPPGCRHPDEGAAPRQRS